MLRRMIRVLVLLLAILFVGAGIAAAMPPHSKGWCDNRYQELSNSCYGRFSDSTSVRLCLKEAGEWYQNCLRTACDC